MTGVKDLLRRIGSTWVRGWRDQYTRGFAIGVVVGGVVGVLGVTQDGYWWSGVLGGLIVGMLMPILGPVLVDWIESWDVEAPE